MLDQSTAPKAPAFLSVSNCPATVTAASCVKNEPVEAALSTKHAFSRLDVVNIRRPDAISADLLTNSY